MAEAPKPLQWYWLPFAVLLIGIFSIVLLFGVDRIRVRQGINAAIISNIMHMQVAAETFHLNVDEIIEGDPTADIGNALATIDDAIGLADSILKNSLDSEPGLIVEPLPRNGLQVRIEEIRGRLVTFRRLGLELVRLHKDAGLGSQADQRFHAASKEIFVRTAALERLCIANSAENQRKAHKFFRVILLAWSFILVAATTGLWRIERRRKRADDSLLDANRQLQSQAEELTRHRENLAEIVVQRTADLTAANEQLHVLSSRLLTAQEQERSRISRELHDELGQALNVTKLRIRAIEKGMRKDRPALHEDCEQLLEYLDLVIEDVRRLSLDLSPTLLEELGLTPAIRRLVDNLAQVSSVNVTTDIEAIDDYVERNQWITIYRVVQEALTNIGRHARADNVTVMIGRRNDRVAFLIEDDGEGFDSGKVTMNDAPDKGLGLTTMAERVCMMNGRFDLWSREGRGTRISFSMPIKRTEQ